ncbi:transglycosylase [Arcticibacter tournemirensis]|uniref:Penicillin-binding protein n=1 Tax=Arcticibacter tournemirensis TaxID=699437 RepID=A0A5M9GXT4_9SPHI|nr:biosynthetic peptidoglycan transglycosylase [Arcticibacter tournemirensis]KAA8477584.1 penicillin-binding protein [Arcticibacter tournemirensis]TQM48387.1 transglycosylase [Arcticibacter tournemirensis]
MHIPSKYLKYIKISGVVVAVLIVIAFVAGLIAYSKREAILETLVQKAKGKAKRDYGLNLAIVNPHFEGLSTIAFSDVSIVPENRDSLLQMSDLHIKVKLLPLLLGDIKLSGLKVKSGKVQLTKRDSIRNYDFLFKKKNDDNANVSSKPNYAQLANKLLNQLLYKIPDDMDLRNFEFLIVRDDSRMKFYVTSAVIDDGDLRSSILINNKESVWHIDGTVEPSDNKLDFKLYAEGKKVELPLIEQKLGLKLNFDTVYTQLKNTKKSGDEFHIYGSWGIKNLLINHPKIAANDIVVPYGSIDADLLIGENYIAVDSSSVIHLRDIEARPYIKYTVSPTKTYELKLRTEEMEAQHVFDSFPIGLFESLEGMKVAGKLQYSLDFFLDAAQPDSVRFSSTLQPQGFRILKWGKINLQKINSPFIYTPYEYGKPMRDIKIGPENPDYTPIDQIAPELRNAVLTAEDPSFFSHRGFVEKSIRRSIATNFKEKAFKRGGSTISMQLVKNVFLNRQKTLARKVEEILIVWLIENNRISDKRRMFEVYLNLIEWGRNVYGIGEASRYYFDKSPSNLNLGESIFLANIIPRPKKSLYYFQPDGSLRTSLRGYFKLIGNLMAARGYVARDTNAYGFYSVRLKESLRQQIAPADSVVVDSLFEADEEDTDLFLKNIFGGKKPDTIHVDQVSKLKVIQEDTTLSRAEKRRLKREQRKKEREQRRNDD